MLQFSHLPNGDLVVTSDTTDTLLKELFVQLPQGMMYVPRSYVPKSVYSYSCRMTLTGSGNAPTLVNPNCDIYEISPISRKLIARDVESFFAALQKQFKEGYTYSEGSATMGFGSNSAVLQSISSLGTSTPAEAQTSDFEDINQFDLNTALTIQDKDTLMVYLDKYGIKADARKSLASLQNWLKAQQLSGE